MAFHVDKDHCKSHNKECFHNSQKDSENTVIVGPHTVVDPRAVMIESFHTLVAHAAMTGFLGSNHFTVRAQQNGVEFLKNFHESDVFGLFEESRISVHSYNMHNKCQSKNRDLGQNSPFLVVIKRENYEKQDGFD